MNSAYFHALPFLQTAMSNPLISIFPNRIQHKPSHLYKNLPPGITRLSHSQNSQLPNLKQPLIPPPRRVVPSDSGDSGGENSGALETVLKLYSAIKNQNVRELSDIIDDECHCICNFFSSFQPKKGKKQVLEFFASLIKFLGDHFEFIVQPTLQDGMVVGIHWRLEWSKAHVSLGTGFSIYTCHVYHGKVMIRNVEMFMEPLLNVEPFRLKVIGQLTTIMDKISLGISCKAWKKKVLCTFFALLFIATILLFSKL